MYTTFIWLESSKMLYNEQEISHCRVYMFWESNAQALGTIVVLGI